MAWEITASAWEVVALDDGGDAVGREDFQRGALAAAERAWVVLAEVERAVDSLRLAVLDDGLGDGVDVGLGEAAVAGVPRCPLVPKLTSCVASARSAGARGTRARAWPRR